MAWLGSILIICSLFIPAYQVFLWLNEGVWTPMTTHVLFSRILPSSFYLWLSDDTSWVGTKEILSTIFSDISLFGFAIWSGLILMVFEPIRLDEYQRKRLRRFSTEGACDSQKAVQEIIARVPSLRDLYASLQCSAYDDIAREKKETLDLILISLADVRDTYGPKNSYFLQQAKQQAKIYLDSDWMHNSGLRNFILSYLIEGEVGIRQVDQIPQKALLAIIIGYMTLEFFELRLCMIWLSVPLLLWMIHKFWNDFKITGLKSVRNEILSGTYDCDEITRRLKKLEKWGIQVESIIYTLLRDKTGNHTDLTENQ